MRRTFFTLRPTSQCLLVDFDITFMTMKLAESKRSKSSIGSDIAHLDEPETRVDELRAQQHPRPLNFWTRCMPVFG